VPGHREALVLLEQERDRLEERLVVLGEENPKWAGQLSLPARSRDGYPAPPDGKSR